VQHSFTLKRRKSNRSVNTIKKAPRFRGAFFMLVISIRLLQ
jgi:hypothetical protein